MKVTRIRLTVLADFMICSLLFVVPIEFHPILGVCAGSIGHILSQFIFPVELSRQPALS